MLKILLLFIGVLACSTSVIFIKESQLHPFLLSAGRQLLASIFLLPLFLSAWRKHRDSWGLCDTRRSVLPALLLGIHFMSWTVAARSTVAANASVIINMTPIVMPFLLYMVIREVLRKQELIGTAIAMCGVVLLVLSDFVWRPDCVRGDLISFASMTLFAAYLVMGRKNRDIPALWLYLVPLYFFSGLFCLVLAILSPDVAVFEERAPREYWILLGMALIPTILGHSLLNVSMRHLRGQLVSICNLFQFVFATIFAWWLLDERPGMVFLPAAALIVVGSGVVIRSRHSRNDAKME